MRTLLLLAAATTALVFATSSHGALRATVIAHASPYGTVLFDSRGFALYAFTHDPRGRSTCSGACATAWPPYLLRGGRATTSGATAKLVGSIRRSDGTRQVTYAGKPLYHYVGDRKPGQILCQNVTEFGGIWLVISPRGTLVR